ncbi:MAG: flippase [Polyangiales bacterium]
MGLWARDPDQAKEMRPVRSIEPDAQVASIHPDHEAAAADKAIAIRSALTLGTSLVGTWMVAILLRILLLPRLLGPQLLGTFSYADNFSATVFIVIGLGVDTYIQKEVPIRPQHASDFFGGFVALRLLLSLALFPVMAVIMTLSHKSMAVQSVVYVFAAGQMLTMMNASIASLIHASRNVSELAVINVGAKFVWGLGMVVALITRQGLLGLAFAFLFSEAARGSVLFALARRYLHLQLRIDWVAVRSVIVSSLPFYINAVAITVYLKVDVSLLSFLSNDTEVGWYSSASNLAGLATLITPLISSVLLPLLSRAGARSEEELFAILRRAIEAILLIAIPISLIMGVGADIWVRYALGRAYAPAALSLRILAPTFVLSYLSMVTATCLIRLNRAWTVTFISIAAVLLSLSLNLVVVPRAVRWFGVGGAGAGAAAVLVTIEVFVALTYTIIIGKRSMDRRSVTAIGKAIAACAVVVVLHRFLRTLGNVRVIIDVLVYGLLVLVVGAVNTDDIKELGRLARSRRGNHAKA